MRAKRIQAMAFIGVNFADHSYDRERYEDVTLIAQQILSATAIAENRALSGNWQRH
ncbi:MAG: NUDIX hydrolase N-terminal domain-containing protein [Pseudomonadota bacterium]|nr:NUDIX hydrolase N-terminal domain-containing protein [Pseudomonadota bacterium]